MAFTEVEVQTLVALWLPVLPAVPPLLGAILGTLVIVSGKVVVIVQKRRLALAETQSV